MSISQPYFIRDNGVSISIHVLPGSSKTAWAGLYGNKFKLKIAEKAIDGAANAALVSFLSRYFDVPKSSITISHGLASKDKTLFVQGNCKSIVKKLDDVSTPT